MLLEMEDSLLQYSLPLIHAYINRPAQWKSSKLSLSHLSARNHGHVVFGPAVLGANLFTLEALLSICRTDLGVLRRPDSLRPICERVSPHRCCTSWSIPHFIALLHNRSSCMDITATDVQKGLGCAAESPPSASSTTPCTPSSTTWPTLTSSRLVDNRGDGSDELIDDWDGGGSRQNDSSSSQSGQGRLVREPHLSYTSVFLPLGQSTMAMAYFKDLEEYGHLEDDVTQVVGMELGLKHALFDEYLLHDTVYVALAGVTVLAAMWAYTQSFLVTAVTCMAVVFSLGTAYFLYTTVFRISFFPFMNVLTLTIAIGIGADDAFIYCKTVTTAAAFFASCVSNITAVRCFGLFAGTAVLASFFFTVTWLPAALIVAEKWCSSTCCLCVPPFGVYLPRLKRFWCCAPVCAALWRLHHSLSEAARVFYDKLLPCIVIRLRWFWLFSLALVAAGGAVAIFVHPRLRLPESPEFQVLSASHLFERYDLDLKERFWFEKARNR
ncbi:hypothetical protein MRX96_049257, partial [Rhipicephalus microplus]